MHLRIINPNIEVSHVLSLTFSPTLCDKTNVMTTTTSNQRQHIDDLHFEHAQWLRELRFYKDELKFFTTRLEEVASRYTSMEVLKELEQFQNQLLIESNVLDELIHDTNEHEHYLASYAIENPVAIDHVAFEDHAPLRERVERNRELQNQFKKSYLRFLSKWL